MKKVGKIIKKYKLLIIGIVLGGIIAGGVVYASTVGASSVSYSNASSGMSATTVQGAIDELYSEADTMRGDYYRKQCLDSNTASYNVSNGSRTLTIDSDLFFSCNDYAITCGNLTYFTTGSNSAPSNAATSCFSSCKTKIGPCCSSKCGSTTNDCYKTCLTWDNYK